jgi:hypothetical protein
MYCVTPLKPAFYHGDDESGWTIMYENLSSMDGLVQGVLIFDTEEEVKQAFEDGGEYAESDNW